MNERHITASLQRFFCGESTNNKKYKSIVMYLVAFLADDGGSSKQRSSVCRLRRMDDGPQLSRFFRPRTT